MLFNSIDFAIFLPIVFLLYWFVFQKKRSVQNTLIIVASYVFYGWWDWRFLSLIAFSSLVDYLVGIGLSKTDNSKNRKLLLLTSIFVNIGFLGFFKYYNFFADSFVEAFSFFGKQISSSGLNIVLPVGISFYTFQTLSYSIDVYKKKMGPTKDVLAFFAFVSFFPQLVAGPIERAKNLLPQFFEKRQFDIAKATDGVRQILWGLFKKMVIADNCATYANDIFTNYGDHSGSTLLLGAVFFGFQIYGDFSGYSDIAIGVARLFGINLMQNFAFPYFSRDIAEFWRRWHISLTTWFRDYVYIPLGGSRIGKEKVIRNVFIVFLVSGMWHGANWTFLMWGMLNAIYFLPLLLLKQNRKHTNNVAEGKVFPSITELAQMSLTFFLITIAWVFFRSETVSDAFMYLQEIFSFSLFSPPEAYSIEIIILIFVLLVVEWLQREKQHALDFNKLNIPCLLRWGIYYTLIIIILLFSGQQQEFIYFQF